MVIWMIAGLGYCYIGYGLRQKEIASGAIGLMLSGFLLVLYIVSFLKSANMGNLVPFFINIALFILILLSWKDLKK